MSVQTSYAKALYEAGQESNLTAEAMDQIEKQLETLSSYLESSKEAQIAFLGPITPIKDKIRLLEQVCNEFKFIPLMSQFAFLLAKKGRLTLLKQIKDAFSEVRLAAEGGVSGQLVAADPLKESDIEFLAKACSQKLGKKVAFRVSADPSLLAGVKVTVNGVTYDGTLRSQIQKLRDQFMSGLPGAHA